MRYVRELREADAFGIRACVLGASATRVHFILFLSGRRKRLAATSELIGMHIDLRTRRSAPFPASVSVAIARLREAHDALAWRPPVCGVLKA